MKETSLIDVFVPLAVLLVGLFAAYAIDHSATIGHKGEEESIKDEDY